MGGVFRDKKGILCSGGVWRDNPNLLKHAIFQMSKVWSNDAASNGFWCSKYPHGIEVLFHDQIFQNYY